MQLKGIDVSYAQGKIDWQKVKADGIGFAMLRAAFGWENKARQTDAQFHANYEGAKAVGIPVGCYHYSYATTVEEAKKEAAFLLDIIKGCQFEYPIAFDLEDKCQRNLPKNVLTDIAIAFCESIRQAGYYPMLYTNLDWIKNRLEMNRLTSYDLWYAQYHRKPTYGGAFGMWQYTSSGRVNGIHNRVDMNICYKDYQSIITNAGLNGFCKQEFCLDTYRKDMKPNEIYTVLCKSPIHPKTEVTGCDKIKIINEKSDHRGWLISVQAIEAGCGHINFTVNGKTQACKFNVAEPTIKSGAKVSYTGRLYGNSFGGRPGKTVSGTFTVQRVLNRKCGVLLPCGWVSAKDCKMI